MCSALAEFLPWFGRGGSHILAITTPNDTDFCVLLSALSRKGLARFSRGPERCVLDSLSVRILDDPFLWRVVFAYVDGGL